MSAKRALAALVAVAMLALPACGGSSAGRDAVDRQRVTAGPYPTEDVTLTMWWWGEQEVPGAKKWLQATIAAYEKKHPNVTIKPVLQTTDSLIPAFKAAAAAEKGPDLQYFWGGIYSQDPGWNDSITPVSDLIDKDELAHYTNASTEATFGDDVWTAPWYVNPTFPLLVRTDVLSEHGLKAPATWSELLKTCDALSAKGVTPMAGGVKDGWFGAWLYTMLGAQSVDSQKDVMKAVVGDQSFTDARHAGWWKRLAEMRDHKCWNDDINSLELYQAQQRFVSGKAAMTVTAGTDAPNFVEKVGADKAKVIPMPAWSDGRYAGKIGSTSQNLGITKWTKYPQVGADFIEFTHEKAQLDSWYRMTGSLPADDRFDLSQVKDPVRKSLFSMVGDEPVPYLENFIPIQLDTEAVFANVQLVLKGDMTAEEAAADMEKKAKHVRATDRELVDNFNTWAR